MSIEILDKGLCTGCMACKNICPVQAIEMLEDKEGFLVPKIDYDKCVSCGKCKNICPNNNLKYKDISLLPKTILVRAKEKDLLLKSASGGICTILSQFFIEEKLGYVCGAIYNENFQVKHILTNNVDDLEKMKQSKYVQSDLEDCFVKIKEQVKKEKYVLFIGTGCQVYALKKFLGKEYKNLYCIDLICHGVPSPKVQREYIKYLRNKYGKIKCINNRNKKTYLHSYVSTYSSEYDNGRKVVRRYSDDPMANAFFSHLSIRPSCYDCRFKSLHRLSDLTVGDFWFSEQYGFGEDLLGINLCLIQSSKGNNLLESINKKIEYKEINSEEAIILNGGMLYSSCPNNKNRKVFFENLGNEPFEMLVKKYDGKSKKIHLKNGIREIIAPFLRNTKYYNKQLIKGAEIRKKRVIPDNKKGLFYYE